MRIYHSGTLEVRLYELTSKMCKRIASVAKFFVKSVNSGQKTLLAASIYWIFLLKMSFLPFLNMPDMVQALNWIFVEFWKSRSTVRHKRWSVFRQNWNLFRNSNGAGSDQVWPRTDDSRWFWKLSTPLRSYFLQLRVSAVYARKSHFNCM